MKYKFLKHESRIYDFLHLPRLLYYKNETDHNDTIEKHNVLNESQLNNIKLIQSKLKPYKQEIETFYYMKEIFSDYDLISLLSRVYPYVGYQDEFDYLTFLKTLSDCDIKKCIVHALLVIKDEKMIALDDVVDELEEIISSDHNIMKFIKNLSLDAAFKWCFFLIVEEPQKYIHKYINFMEQLHPIFIDHYKNYKEEVVLCGTKLVDYLNIDVKNSLDEITFNTLSAKLFLDKEENFVYISSLFPMLSLSTNPDQKNVIVWGLYMEETFKKLNEINQNKTNERVQIFKNLGDKTRYEVLKLIASGITSTKEIAEKLGVSSATISYHISNFITSRIIKMDNTNNKKFGYIVDYELLENVFNELKEDLSFPKK